MTLKNTLLSVALVGAIGLGCSGLERTVYAQDRTEETGEKESSKKAIDDAFYDFYGKINPEVLESYNLEGKHKQVIAESSDLITSLNAYETTSLSKDEKERLGHFYHEVSCAYRKSATCVDDYDTAKRLGLHAIELFPDCAALYLNLGYIFWKGYDNKEKAAEFFGKYLQRETDSESSIPGKAVAWLKKYHFEKHIPEKYAHLK